MRTLFALTLSFLIGCIGAPDPSASTRQALDPATHSGTRIEIRSDNVVNTFDDGATFASRETPYFYDTILDHECEPIAVSSTLGGCFPTSDATLDGKYPGKNWTTSTIYPGSYFLDTSRMYADSGCTRMLAALPDPSGTADPSKMYAREYGKTTVYALTHELSRPTTLYYKQTYPSTCQPTTAVPGPPFRLFEVSTVTGFTSYTISHTVEVL